MESLHGNANNFVGKSPLPLHRVMAIKITEQPIDIFQLVIMDFSGMTARGSDELTYLFYQTFPIGAFPKWQLLQKALVVLFKHSLKH